MPPPVISSPPGYVSEDVHGESQGSQMIVAIGTTLSLATIIFLLRIVVKKYIVHSVGWEDYFAGSAVLLAIGRTSLIILCELCGTLHLCHYLIPSSNQGPPIRTACLGFPFLKFQSYIHGKHRSIHESRGLNNVGNSILKAHQ